MPNGRPFRNRQTTFRHAPELVALIALLSLGSGCQRLPLRRTEVEPIATSTATTVVEPASTALDRPAEVALQSPATPFPTGGAEEIAPTPLLDAALARVQSVSDAKTAATSDDESPVELPTIAKPAATPTTPAPPATAEMIPDFDLAIPEIAQPAAKPTAPVKSPHDPEVTRAATEDATRSKAPKPLETPAEVLPGPTTDSEPARSTKAIDPEKPVPSLTDNKDDWEDGLSRIRALARVRAGEPGAAAEAWAIRARVLDWLAGDADDPRGETTRAWNRVLAALSTATSSETVDENALGHHLAEAVETLESFVPLQIRVLSLCRKVQGFGQYEPLDEPTARAGRPLLVYCEMDGLQYEQAGDDIQSRLASRVEVVPSTGGEPVWSQALGTAEDHCRRRRRDYYVNYRLALPTSLAPGPYALRLIQTDLLSGRSVSSSLAFRVNP